MAIGRLLKRITIANRKGVSSTGAKAPPRRRIELRRRGAWSAFVVAGAAYRVGVDLDDVGRLRLDLLADRIGPLEVDPAGAVGHRLLDDLGVDHEAVRVLHADQVLADKARVVAMSVAGVVLAVAVHVTLAVNE